MLYAPDKLVACSARCVTMVIYCYGDMSLWRNVAMVIRDCVWCTKGPHIMEGALIQWILGPRCQLRRQNELVVRSAYVLHLLPLYVTISNRI